MELRLIIEKERAAEIIPLIGSTGGLTPHARPMISEPRFGNRNSDLDIFANSFAAVGTNEHHPACLKSIASKVIARAEISSRTGIPRSTVGYYVRKFNELAAKGKPVVLPGLSLGLRMPRNYTEDIPLISRLETKILGSIGHGAREGLYYRERFQTSEGGRFTYNKWSGEFSQFVSDLARSQQPSIARKPARRNLRALFSASGLTDFSLFDSTYSSQAIPESESE